MDGGSVGEQDDAQVPLLLRNVYSPPDATIRLTAFGNGRLDCLRDPLVTDSFAIGSMTHESEIFGRFQRRHRSAASWLDPAVPWNQSSARADHRRHGQLSVTQRAEVRVDGYLEFRIAGVGSRRFVMTVQYGYRSAKISADDGHGRIGVASSAILPRPVTSSSISLAVSEHFFIDERLAMVNPAAALVVCQCWR